MVKWEVKLLAVCQLISATSKEDAQVSGKSKLSFQKKCLPR